MNPQQLIANRFELQNLLGRGGMGEVYRAVSSDCTDRFTGNQLNLKSFLSHSPVFVCDKMEILLGLCEAL